MARKTVLTYRESMNFANQFRVNHRRASIHHRTTRVALVAVISSGEDHAVEYANERRAMIDTFNRLLIQRLRADERLSLDSFQLVRSLGQGGYGSVFLAYHSDTREYLALKAMEKAALVETDEQTLILSERQYAFALRHPNIVISSAKRSMHCTC